MNDGDWCYSALHKQYCQLIRTETLWSKKTCWIWLQNHNSIIQVPLAEIQPLEKTAKKTQYHFVYKVAAARLMNALNQDIVISPIESTVIPLPHQIRALQRAIQNDHLRYLLADEVGLGKTIEAGLIMRELKLRGMIKRILIVVPKGLATQWISEMRFHFGETFHFIDPEDLKTLKRLTASQTPYSMKRNSSGLVQRAFTDQTPQTNPWQMFDQAMVSMDSVKPMDKRRGWSADRLKKHNQDRFEELISAGWDLIIVDEAHKLGGSSDQVARFKLGQGLSGATPYLLLLSATPHQGKTDAFHRLMSIIDEEAFPDIQCVVKERVQPYVIRTEKRHTIDADGNPLFTARRTELVPVSWKDQHHEQRALYSAVTEYVRMGYNQALKEKRNYIGFLMILMQRLVVSSTQAIQKTLERRLEVLRTPNEQLSLFPMISEDEWLDLDSQEQLDTLLSTRIKALKNERDEVKMLLNAAQQCIHRSSDAKAEALLEWIYQLQAEEGDPELKILVFTEFVPTQEMLSQFLSDRGFSVICLNGSMNLEERKRAQESFAGHCRIMISTDAGGEGLNLQFCHIVINYDIPWNPMKLEQRIGRVDRIGQKHIVRAINFVFQDSVEHRIHEVLEEKLSVIFEEFGIDKTSDVLDSAQANQIFDDVYVKGILNPDEIENTVSKMVDEFQYQIQKSRETKSLLGSNTDLSPTDAKQLLAHPLPHWIERMTVSYLKANGGKAEKRNNTWRLVWPDGTVYSNIVFSNKEAEEIPTAQHLSLEDPKIRNIVDSVNQFVPGQPIPIISLTGISKQIKGYWSLWRISLSASNWNRYKIMPLFLSENGKMYFPTAKSIWDQLMVSDPVVHSHLDSETSRDVLDQLRIHAEEYGKPIYDQLVEEHKSYILKEREKSEYSFVARRKAIKKVGLPEVRNYRLNQLELEEYHFKNELEQKSQAYPELMPLVITKVVSEVNDE